MEIIKKGNTSFLVSDKINVPHGFSLRHGGVSEGDFGSLNVGLRRGDNPFNAIENIKLCVRELALNEETLTLTYQTHTPNVELVTYEDIGKGFVRPWEGGVDGIVTGLKNVPLMCYSADCVPTLLYEPKVGLVGAVHGGWRGTRDNIISNAVDLMCKEGSKAENIIAFIGPAIGMCCYEVSDTVADEFKDYPHFVTDKGNGKYMLDLKGVTKAQLMEMGVRNENIDIATYCTACCNDLFFSHRKQNGKSGLLGGFIQMN